MPWNLGQEVIGPPAGMPFAVGSSAAEDCKPPVLMAKSFAFGALAGDSLGSAGYRLVTHLPSSIFSAKSRFFAYGGRRSAEPLMRL